MSIFKNIEENKKVKQDLMLKTEIAIREQCNVEFAKEKKQLIDNYEKQISFIQEANIKRIREAEETINQELKSYEKNFIADKKQAIEELKEAMQATIELLNIEIKKYKIKLKNQAARYSEEISERDKIIYNKNAQLKQSYDGYLMYRQHVLAVYEKAMQFKVYVETIFKDMIGTVYQKANEFLNFFEKEVDWLESNHEKIENKMNPKVDMWDGKETHYEVTKKSLIT